MKLAELLTVRRDPEQPRSARGKALRLLVGFLALMALCTLLSRAADSLTVATVTVQNPARAALTHTTRLNGQTVADDEQAVSVLDGARVERVAVREGDAVMEGDLLYTLDVADLQEQLKQKQLEQQKYSIQIAQAQRQSARQEQRADEDLGTAEDNALYELEQAEDEVGAARGELRRFRESYEDVLQGYRSSDTIDPEDPDFAIINQYRMLRDNYQAKEKAYEAASRAQEKSLLEAQRKLEDAQDSDSAGQLASIDYQLGQMAIGRLNAWIAAEGKRTADEAGIVTKVSVGAGKRASGSEPAILLTSNEKGLQFVADADTDDLKQIEQGGTATIQLAGEQQPLQGVTIGQIRPGADGTGKWKVSVQLPLGVGGLGTAGTLEASRKTSAYDCCVPLRALRRDGPHYYVLVLREQQTVLGTELVAERIGVTVLDQNESRAAVSGGLLNEDRVIESSSKEIGEGDRVRLVEE